MGCLGENISPVLLLLYAKAHEAVSNELEEEDTVNMITYIFAFFMHSVSIFVTLETN